MHREAVPSYPPMTFSPATWNSFASTIDLSYRIASNTRPVLHHWAARNLSLNILASLERNSLANQERRAGKSVPRDHSGNRPMAPPAAHLGCGSRHGGSGEEPPSVAVPAPFGDSPMSVRTYSEWAAQIPCFNRLMTLRLGRKVRFGKSRKPLRGETPGRTPLDAFTNASIYVTVIWRILSTPTSLAAPSREANWYH
jgi:hypothetical protein